MEEYVVDFSGVTDKESFHACLKKSLPLPEWYGENLDALYDSLTELDEACIYFKNCGHAAESLADYFESFLNVIADAQMEVQGLFCFLENSSGENAFSGDGEDSVGEAGEEDSGAGSDEDDSCEEPGEDDSFEEPGEDDSCEEPGEDDDFGRDPDEE